MAHNAAVHVLGQGPQMSPGNGVREETVQMLKRVISVAIACFALIVVTTKRDSLIQVIDHPIASIKVTGTFSYLKEAEINQALSNLIGAGFIATNLEEVQAQVESLAWVQTATVSRVWPGQIKLLISEQVAVSQWNQGALMNAAGVVFQPSELSQDLLVLPQLLGSDDYSQAKKNLMFSTLGTLQEGLASYGLDVRSLELKPRNVWNMTLANGVAVAMGEIKLEDREGRQTLDSKLERVGKIFGAHANIETEKIERIDARYPNGVAIKWRTEQN